jgi:hypothetical protein
VLCPVEKKLSVSFDLFSDDEAERQRALESQKDDSVTNPGNGAIMGQSEMMWFEHEPCVEYWLERGVAVIKKLGLKMEHGVH